MVYDVMILGGGASGLMAAYYAKSAGASVVLLEKNDRVGKKILATGNGQCNLSNLHAEDETAYHGQDTRFVRGAFRRFGVETTLNFFETQGILPKTTADGKVYPNSLQASSVLDALRFAIPDVETICGFDCVKLIKKKDAFYACDQTDRTVAAKCVIVCAGGSAGTKFGTNGKGYVLLEAFGHQKSRLFPSLVPLTCDAKRVIPMKGVKIDAQVSMLFDGEIKRVETGEVLFTEYGLSGPPVFQLSGQAVEALADGKEVVLSLDLFPQFVTEKLYSYLIGRNKDVTIEQFLAGMLPKQLGRQIMKEVCACKMTDSAKFLTDSVLHELAHILKHLQYFITGSKGWDRAQVTKGGVLTKDFDPASMESKRTPGLFAAGEILDIDGDCGGYNLQWAFSSGALAGYHAAKKAKGEV